MMKTTITSPLLSEPKPRSKLISPPLNKSESGQAEIANEYRTSTSLIMAPHQFSSKAASSQINDNRSKHSISRLLMILFQLVVYDIINNKSVSIVAGHAVVVSASSSSDYNNRTVNSTNHHHQPTAAAPATITTTMKPVNMEVMSSSFDNNLQSIQAPPQEQRLALQIFIADQDSNNNNNQSKVSASNDNLIKKSPYSFEDQQLQHAERKQVVNTKTQEKVSNNDSIDRKKINSNRPHSGFKRPYDEIYLQEPLRPPPALFYPDNQSQTTTIDNNSNRHFYFLDSALLREPFENYITTGNPTSAATTTTSTTSTRRPQRYETIIMKQQQSNNQKLQEYLRPKKTILNQRSELVRTQHRPPWLKSKQRPPSISFLKTKQASSFNPNSRLNQTTNSNDLLTSGTNNFNNIKKIKKKNANKNKFRFTTTTTTSAPLMSNQYALSQTTATEFFKLISSAHSPVRIHSTTKQQQQQQINQQNLNNNYYNEDGIRYMLAGSATKSPSSLFNPSLRYKATTTAQPTNMASNNSSSSLANYYQENPASLSSNNQFIGDPSITTTLQPINSYPFPSKLVGLNKGDGRVTSPAILVNDDEEDSDDTAEEKQSTGAANGQDLMDNYNNLFDNTTSTSKNNDAIVGQMSGLAEHFTNNNNNKNHSIKNNNSPSMPSSASSFISLNDNYNMSSSMQNNNNNSIDDAASSADSRSQLLTISSNSNNSNGDSYSYSNKNSLLLGPDEMPTTYFSGPNKIPVTIIRQSATASNHRLSNKQPALLVVSDKTNLPNGTHTTLTTTTTTTTLHSSSSSKSSTLTSPPPQALSSSSISNLPALGNNSTGQLVRLIAKHKHKFDDNVISPTLTVVDNAAMRLPPNATSVHNNKLIVAIRPGRPHRRYPPTTQFPVYNIVAGLKPPYTTPATLHFTRPPSIDGSVYGLLKPTTPSPNGQQLNESIITTTSTTTSSFTTPLPSFGAQNIKFPAQGPSVVQIQPPPMELIDKFNISVPDNANIVGPNKVPDRIQMETQEQHIQRPPEVILTSDININVKPTTTRKPARQSTTKRINIVSANTTVVTTNVDELHDVLTDVIAGSHQQDHMTHINRPLYPRPTILASISNLFSAGVTTSAVAVLTLIKTIFMAILVMFLPPIALTAAIMQAVSLG